MAEATEAGSNMVTVAEATEASSTVTPATGGVDVVMMSSTASSNLSAISLSASWMDWRASSLGVESVSLIQRRLICRALVCDVKEVDWIYLKVGKLFERLDWMKNLEVNKVSIDGR